MKVGDRVLVWREINSWFGAIGSVTELGIGKVWVHIDGERLPMSFARSEVSSLEESGTHLAGAE